MNLMKIAIIVAASAAALSACDSKRDEDVAAIRAQMEKDAAEKQAAQEKSKERLAAMRRNAEKSAKNQGQ